MHLHLRAIFDILNEDKYISMGDHFCMLLAAYIHAKYYVEYCVVPNNSRHATILETYS